MQTLFHAFRRNKMGETHRSVLVSLLSEELGLSESNATALADMFDEILAGAGIADLTQEAFDDYIPVVLEAAQEMKAQQTAPAKDAMGPVVFEPAVVFPKPYKVAGVPFRSLEWVLAGLAEMVDMLAQEGPVKGSGAAQRSEEAEIGATSKRIKQNSRRTRRNTRRNPYRAGSRLARKYRANPFLPDDQDPLSVYRARLIRPGKAPLTLLEHLRAARLLLAHTKDGGQNPPDFDSQQVTTFVKMLETEAQREGWKIPTGPIKTEDYRIVNPQGGSVRWIYKGLVLGLLHWKWAGKKLFTIQFPWYDEGEQTGTVDRFLFAPLGETDPKVGDLLTVSQFVGALEGAGFRAEVQEQSRGQFILLGLRAGINAGKAVALSIIEAGKALKNESMQEFGMRLGVAWRMWAHLAGDDATKAGAPSGATLQRVGLPRDLAEIVASFYSTAQEAKPSRYLAEIVGAAETVPGSSWRRDSSEGINLLATARVLEAIQGPTTSIIGLPTPSEKYPTQYVWEARPEDVVIALPPGAIPFRIENTGRTHRYTIWLGTDATSGAPGVDNINLRSAFWNTAQTDGRSDAFPSLESRTPDKPGIEPSSSAWVLSYVPTQGNKLATIGSKKNAYSVSKSKLLAFAEGLERFGSSAGPDPDGKWFSLSFYEKSNSYRNRPKAFDSPYFLFLPLAAAIRKGVLLQGLSEFREGVDEVDGQQLTLALSEASPTSSGVPVGAGRLESVQVTSVVTQRSVTAPGLPAPVLRQIRNLMPPKSFRYAFVEKKGGKVGAGTTRKKRVFYPYPFQQVGIAFIHAARCRAMIGDEMGLGKTIQALGALALDPSPTTGQSMLPALVICPASVVGSWENEVKRWLPHLSVGSVGEVAGNFDVSVMSWGMVSRHYAAHVGRYMTVIVDEAHYGKRLYKIQTAGKRPTLKQLMAGKLSEGSSSPFTLRTYGFVRLAQSAPHAILLSGTLMENGGKDAVNMWTYLHALDPQRYPDQKRFADAFFSKNKKGKAKSAAAVLTELVPFRQAVNQYHLRRMKSTVAEQINLGCFYSPEYGQSDPGCAGGAGAATVIQSNGSRRNGRRKLSARTTRRNGSGFVRVGVTKIIEKNFVVLSPVQQALYDDMQQKLVDEIKRTKVEHAIKSVIRVISQGTRVDLKKLPTAVAEMNMLLGDQDASRIAATALAVYHYNRKMVGQLKIPQAVKLISQSLQEREPVIVWVDQREVGDEIISLLDKGVRYAVIRGGVEKSARTSIVKNFQEGKIDVIVASQAMREGVTLTRANRAIFVELWWVGAWLSQAEDRIYRIGQERDCTITYMLLDNSIDTEMWSKIERKKAVQELVFGADQFKTDAYEGDELEDTVDPNMSAEDRKKQERENAALIKGFQKSSDDEKGEEADVGAASAAAALIQEATSNIINKLLSQAKNRQEVQEMQIDEEMVYDALLAMDLKDVTYSVTPTGLKWSDRFTLRMPAQQAWARLGRFVGVSATQSRLGALRTLERIGTQNEKGEWVASSREVRASSEGTNVLRTLRGLVSEGHASIPQILKHTGGVALSDAEGVALETLQSIVTGTQEQIPLEQILQAAIPAFELAGRRTKLSASALKNMMAKLVSKKLVQKHEEAADLRRNSGQPKLKVPAPTKAMQDRWVRNQGAHTLNAARYAAAQLGAALGLRQYPEAARAYGVLEAQLAALRDQGARVPRALSQALRDGYKTLSGVYGS